MVDCRPSVDGHRHCLCDLWQAAGGGDRGGQRHRHDADVSPPWASDEECRVFRIRTQGSADWQYITEPADGVLVKLTDLMLLAEEVQKFEDDRDLLRRPSLSTGAAPRYDWEAVNIMLLCRINDHGLPATQGELINEVQDWFAQNSPTGEIPEESTTRKKIAPIWRALRERD